MLRLILTRDTTIIVESVQSASDTVVEFLDNSGRRPGLFIGGQVYDDEKNLVAVVFADGEIITEETAAPHTWTFHTLAMQMNVGGC